MINHGQAVNVLNLLLFAQFSPDSTSTAELLGPPQHSSMQGHTTGGCTGLLQRGGSTWSSSCCHRHFPKLKLATFFFDLGFGGETEHGRIAQEGHGIGQRAGLGVCQRVEKSKSFLWVRCSNIQPLRSKSKIVAWKSRKTPQLGFLSSQGPHISGTLRQPSTPTSTPAQARLAVEFLADKKVDGRWTTSKDAQGALKRGRCHRKTRSLVTTTSVTELKGLLGVGLLLFGMKKSTKLESQTHGLIHVIPFFWNIQPYQSCNE